jgi:hypothetical protein
LVKGQSRQSPPSAAQQAAVRASITGGDLMSQYNAYKQGGNMFSKRNLNKGLKVGLKGLKQANKVGKLMGYDSLQDMAIEGIVQNTVGRVDPTGMATAAITNELQKQADKQIEKHGGGFVKIGSGYAFGGSVNSGRVIRNFEMEDLLKLIIQLLNKILFN